MPTRQAWRMSPVGVRTRFSVLRRMFAGLVVVAASWTSIPAFACDRPARRCDHEERAFETRVQRAQRRHRAQRDALEALRLRRRVACFEWNTCAIDDELLGRTRQWAGAEIDALERMEEQARGEWARGLATRASIVTNPLTTQPGTAFQPQITPQIRQMLARMEQTIEGLEQLEALLPQLGSSIALPANGDAPAVCSNDALRAAIRVLVRGGSSSAGTARHYRNRLEDLCSPWEQWRNPDEGMTARMRRFLTRVTRVEGWMNGVLTGRADDADKQQARRALRELEQVRRVVRGVPSTPFPCRNPLWQRLAESEWTLRVARAQMPSLGERAKSLCEAIGFDLERLEQIVSRLRDHLERQRAQTTSQLRTYRESLARMRRTYNVTDE